VLNLTPHYGYAPQGQRAYAPRPVQKGTRISTIGAISQQGLLTAMCYQGTLNGNVFSYFIKEFLLEFLTPQKVLILDNATAHKNQEALQWIESQGARVLYLPPYSPEMNPIEYCWARVKQTLRDLAPRNVESLYEAWAKALKLMDAPLTNACFKHCGFV